MLLAGDDLILQVMGVFTRIRSGTTQVADYGDTSRSNLVRGGGSGGSRAAEGHRCRSIQWLQLRGMKIPKGLNAYF
jgi:hypothetical protein